MKSNRFKSYHAHIYYDPKSRKMAEAVRKHLSNLFQVELGRWHDEPVGPHPQGMYQVAFKSGQFARIVPWLMQNRSGLSVLVHPNTKEDLADHSTHALWLGKMLKLKLGMFRKQR